MANEPSPPNKVSPHYHDDFEQCSLTLQGDYMHYIRWPWTPNKAIWREDAKIRCTAPSITIIPPPAIHTSQALPPAPCHLIDIFGPPRVDFSLKRAGCSTRTIIRCRLQLSPGKADMTETRPHPREFRKRLQAGEPLLGTFMKVPATQNTEVLGLLGFDFVVLDEEHARGIAQRSTRACSLRVPPARLA